MKKEWKFEYTICKLDFYGDIDRKKTCVFLLVARPHWLSNDLLLSQEELRTEPTEGVYYAIELKKPVFLEEVLLPYRRVIDGRQYLVDTRKVNNLQDLQLFVELWCTGMYYTLCTGDDFQETWATVGNDKFQEHMRELGYRTWQSRTPWGNGSLNWMKSALVKAQRL